MNAVSDQAVLAVAAPEAAVVVKALLQVLPAHCVLSRTEDTRPYECDGLSLYRSVPMAVVLPETEAQVQAVLITCKKTKRAGGCAWCGYRLVRRRDATRSGCVARLSKI